ncbi:MAG TPA: glycosyltransferase family 39 protein [Candidatus Dormibacteraeota bacterium]
MTAALRAFPLPPTLGLVLGSLVLACLAAAAFWVVRRWVPLDSWERRFLTRLLAVALAVRVLGALVVYYKLPYGYFAPDANAYIKEANDWVFRGDHNIMALMSSHLWGYIVIALIGVFDHPLLPNLLACLAGTFATVPAYLLARRLGAGRYAAWTALIVVFYPSTILWSIIDVKDAPVYLVVFLAFLVLFQIEDTPWPDLALVFLGLVLGIHMLRQFADTVMLVAGLAALMAVGVREASRRAPRAVAAAGSLLVLGVLVAPLVFRSATERVYARLGLPHLAVTRHNFAEGARSAVDPDPGLQTFHGALAFFPKALVNFWLRPFPWEHGAATSQLTRPEMLLWYCLIPIVLIGIVRALRDHPLRTVPLLVYVAVASTGYAYVISNLGTAFRERDQLLMVLFVFVGPAAAVAVPRIRGLLHASRGPGPVPMPTDVRGARAARVARKPETPVPCRRLTAAP